VRFGGLQKISLIDFPDRIATVLFTPSCNLRCPYCHNWRLVLDPKGPFLSEDDVLQILESQRRFVDAVVITGGEPTMHRDIPLFLEKLKRKGFAVKLDTNGFFPEVLERCLPYLDYVAVDVKTCPERYRLLGAADMGSFFRTIGVLKKGSVDYEFRNTVVPGIVDEDCIAGMGELVKGVKRFVFQQFVPGDTLDKVFNTINPYSPETIVHFADIMSHYVEEVKLRL
jgi:pyruvate formate lyase activating enzyme